MTVGANDIVAVGPEGAIRWERFAADSHALAAGIRGAGAIANLWSDRYRFLVGLAAARLNGQPTLLPSAPAPKALESALEGTVNPCLLVDGPLGLWPCVTDWPSPPGPSDTSDFAAALASGTADLQVFTSGSTGMPVRHRKSWQMLLGGAEITRHVLACDPDGSGPMAVIATVPHQHMYGLEAAAFAALSGGACLHRARVFYPADLEAAVADLRRAGLSRAALVTSPAHLRYLDGALAGLPEIRLVISATAPLGEAVAQRIEREAEAPVYEIYGSTETGSLAVRRTAEGPLWAPQAGFRLAARPEGTLATAPHLAGPVLLGDALALEPDGRFRLLGRLGDMINIAGKRSSIGALSALLADAPGLADAVLVADRSEDGDRLVLFAVPSADGAALGEAALKRAIRDHVREHADPVFVPQRMQFVDRLARTETGKISAEERARLLCLIAE